MEQVNLRDYFNSRLQYLYPLEQSNKMKVKHIVSIKNEIKSLNDIILDEININLDLLPDESYIEHNHTILLKNIENIKEYFNSELENLNCIAKKSGVLDRNNLENIKRQLKMFEDSLSHRTITENLLNNELTSFQKLYMEKELERDKYINEITVNVQNNINKLESDYSFVDKVNPEQNNSFYKKLTAFFGWSQ